MCAPEVVAFGTVTPMAVGLDNVMRAQWHKVWANIRDFTVHTDRRVGAVIGEQGWVATTWDSLGKKPDGSTFRRPGRLTVAFERRHGRWLATHTHFSLFPQPQPRGRGTLLGFPFNKETPMHHGICMFATEYAIRIDELARECESRGFESLWVPEHTHIPTSRRSPFAGGQPLPEQYKHTLDPFVALMAAAAATKNLRVGTGICLIIERDTITTAKAVASLDLLSNGRFELGIGGGWNAREWSITGRSSRRASSARGAR
jgi:ketosteroid isomerase-like protein